MDMQLNKEHLRRERELRAWSQSHLAEVAGLSMRTVQRIEGTGSASLESAKAIAAALDTQVEALLLAETLTPKPRSIFQRVSLIVAFFASVLLAFSWWSHAYADQIMVDLLISEGDEKIASVQMLNENGKPSETKIDNLLRLLITSSRVDENVLIATEIYLFNGKTFELKGQPKLLAAKNQAAAMSFSSDDGRTFRFIFTPH